MSYQEDKRELLKLKQGLIEESEQIHEEEKPVYEIHGAFKKIENFFYHYKWHVVVGLFAIVVLSFLVVSTLTKEKGDIRVLVMTKNPTVASSVLYKTGDYEVAFERFCPDFDDSGYIHAEIYNIDLSDNVDPEYMMAGVTKATSEIQLGESQMYIVDKEGLDAITDGDYSTLMNLSELYPDCPYIDGYFFKIKESPFAYECNYAGACPDNLYIVVRSITPDGIANPEKSREAQKKALEVLDNIINGNYAGWIDDQGRIYGVSEDNLPSETEEVKETA